MLLLVILLEVKMRLERERWKATESARAARLQVTLLISSRVLAFFEVAVVDETLKRASELEVRLLRQ